MKIYEGFLNGDLAVGRNGQQVHASDLFWDNDIEYCFFDIDEDGAEELHIRDGAVYYNEILDILTGWDNDSALKNFEG